MLGYTTKDNEEAIISVGIIKDGKASFTVYGQNATILPDHEFGYEIGSITKTFTTSLLSKALFEEKTTLSDSIDRYVELPIKNRYPDFQQLVTHTSGYKNYYFDWHMVANVLNGEKNDYYGISTVVLDEKIGRIDYTHTEHAFTYSNFGISVVGSALAKIYEKDFASLMNDFIVSDLNLEQTRVSDGTGDLTGYWNWGQNDAYIPAGAIVSTIDDMLQYVQLHLEEKLPYLSLGHATLKHVQATTKTYEKMGIRIDAVGMGWMIDNQKNILWHNGATSNFNSYVAFDKEKQIGVVILSNLPPNYRIPATVMGIKLLSTL
jgi:CubicO group peptidase (beta-lactamase class C family)